MLDFTNYGLFDGDQRLFCSSRLFAIFVSISR